MYSSRSASLAHDLRRVAHALEVGLVAPLGGERDGLALDDAAHLEELAEAALLDGEGSESESFSGLRKSATANAPLPPALISPLDSSMRSASRTDERPTP